MNTESYVTNLIIAESNNRQKAFWQTMAIQVLAQAKTVIFAQTSIMQSTALLPTTTTVTVTIKTFA